jgi:hypothetical protein
MYGTGYMDDHNTSSSKNQKFAPRSGLLPITAKIFNNLEVKPDDSLEYKGNIVSDIVIVGYITEYNEGSVQVNLKVWDGTGIINAQFFNKNESEAHPGLLNFQYNGGKKLVRLFGHAKVFKKDKQFSGNKILYTDEKDFQLHSLEVIHCWLNLTGKMDEIKSREKTMYDENVKNIGKNNNNFSTNNYHQTSNNNNSNFNSHEQMIMDMVKESRNRKVPINDILNKLNQKISKDKITSTIEKLCNDGYLLEESGILSLL